MNKILPESFYCPPDVGSLARSLLGKCLHTKINGQHTAGIIVETEAYNGIHDKACHAYEGRQTKRTESMYAKGGHTYVYLCYGIHSLFNIVSGPEKTPTAILIRAIEPVIGIPCMLKRKKLRTLDHRLCSGPGSLTKALGINTRQDKLSLNGPLIYVTETEINLNTIDIISSPRVGVDYAKEDANLPYRFYIKGNKWISRIK